MIDTHTHLFTEEFKEDIDQVIERAKAAGVSQMLLPNIDTDSIDALLSLVEKHDSCKAMMGLHPSSVQSNYQSQLQIIYEQFKHHKFIAVGEIGIDYYWDLSFKNEQEQAFKTQLNWAKEMQLPVSVHCREAYEDTIRFIQEEQNGQLSGVLHCFGGNLEEAKKLIDLNFKLGMGGVLTFKKSHLPEILPEIGLENLVLETDAPYLAPMPFRGKRNEPAYLIHIVEKLAAIFQTDEKNVAFITQQNAKSVFKLN